MPDTGSLYFSVIVNGVTYTANNVNFNLTGGGTGGGGGGSSLLKDDFTASDNTAIAGRTVPISTVANRVYSAEGSSGGGVIIGNKAELTANQGFLVAVGQSNSGIEIGFTAPLRNNMRVYYGSALGADSAANKRYVRIENQYFSIDYGDNNYVDFGAIGALTVGTVYRFNMLVKASTIELWANGSKKASLGNGGFISDYVGIKAPGSAMSVEDFEVIVNTGNTLLGKTTV